MHPNKWLNDRIILEAYAGSKVYGTETKDSDVDLRGVAVPPRSYIYGLNNFKNSVEKDPDRTIYSIHRWADLALKGNPNTLELLWTPDNYFVKKTKEGQLLIDNRDLFLGKHLKKPYFGYAMSQLSRMTKLNKNANTNPRRVSDIEKYGMDCKNLLHLVRLMRMCFEVLTEGTLHVQRFDSQELVEIRNGKWSYEKGMREMNRLKGLIDQAMVTTSLPAKPDRKGINALIIDIVSSMMEEENERAENRNR